MKFLLSKTRTTSSSVFPLVSQENDGTSELLQRPSILNKSSRRRKRKHRKRRSKRKRKRSEPEDEAILPAHAETENPIQGALFSAGVSDDDDEDSDAFVTQTQRKRRFVRCFYVTDTSIGIFLVFVCIFAFEIT